MTNRIFIKELELKDGKFYQLMANEGLWSKLLTFEEMLELLKKLLK